MKIAQLCVVACVCFALCGCATFQAVEASMPVKISADITVDPQIEWARPNDLVALRTAVSGGTVWTADGLGLDEVRFLTDIAQGRPLLQITGVDFKDLGRYNPTMLPDDVMDLLSSTLGKAGNQQVRATNLRPVPFGSVAGFRFDLTFLTADGLQMKGAVLMAQRNQKLDLILFIAPSEYYYDHYAPIVERIFASIRIPDAKPATRRAG